MAMQNEANANRVGASGAVEAAIQNVQSGLDLSTADMALKEHDPGLVRQQSMCTPLQRLTNTLDPCALCKSIPGGAAWSLEAASLIWSSRWGRPLVLG